MVRRGRYTGRSVYTYPVQSSSGLLLRLYEEGDTTATSSPCAASTRTSSYFSCGSVASASPSAPLFICANSFLSDHSKIFALPPGPPLPPSPTTPTPPPHP